MFSEHSQFLRSAKSGEEDFHFLFLAKAELRAGDEVNLPTTVHENPHPPSGDTLNFETTRATLHPGRSPVDGV